MRITPSHVWKGSLLHAAWFIPAAAGWLLVLWQSAAMTSEGPGLTMGMGPPLFLLVWVAMMCAMMLPAAAPMIMTFARVSAGRRERREALAPTWVFVSAYLAVWALAGVMAYAAALQADRLVQQSRWLTEHAPGLTGGIVILAGLYQFSPLKHACLSKCRTPLSFILGSWREGSLGAFRMGLEHGGYCLGCCWLLFAILFPLGVMNLPVMALMTALVVAEKSLTVGHQIARVVGLAILAYGVLIIVLPGALS